MTRSIDIPCPTPPNIADHHPGYKAATYKIKLVTPMYGGGPVAGQLDPVTLISPKGIRGQLRFWWRATRGTLCKTPQELARREREIFGSPESPSPVIIEVAAPEWKEPRSHREDYGFERSGPENYALFSARQNEAVLCREGLLFDLTLRWAGEDELARLRAAENRQRKKAKKPPLPQKVTAVETDLQAALWAWVAFGGVGARTRRGCGCLSSHAFLPSKEKLVGQWWIENIERFGLSLTNHSTSWPTLSADVWIQKNTGSALNAWKEAVALLQDFRQGRNVGRNRGGRLPGRSNWPEAESIRAATGSRGTRHPRQTSIPDDAFPRAEFGLPIIFQFVGAGEPEKTELRPVISGEVLTRMSSPLILKPLVLASGQALPMLVRLNTPPVEAVLLSEKTEGMADTPLLSGLASAIRGARLAKYPNSPLRGPSSSARSSGGSAVEAFLAFADEKGFTKIT